jgi:hypothetical protein
MGGQHMISYHLTQDFIKYNVSVVHYFRCESWLLTLREERRLKVFENRVLRRIFGPKKDEVKGKWRQLHNEELHDLYSSPSIVWVIKTEKNEMGGACSAYGEGERCV